MTVAVDLVIRGIQEPVRFPIETSVRVFSQTERFWYFQRRSLIQQFFLNLKEVSEKKSLSESIRRGKVLIKSNLIRLDFTTINKKC